MYKTKNISNGDILSYYISNGDNSYPVSLIKNEINNSQIIKPRFKIYVLNPDETIKYEIPEADIISGGSYNENYQNGQRRALAFSLYNFNKKYTPTINNLWSNTKIKFEIGLEINNDIAWFPRGIFVITNISPSFSQETVSVSVEASDKFYLLENDVGVLDETYEVPVGSNIKDVITSLLQKQIGNGEVLDPSEFIYNYSFKDKTTQAVISKEVGDNVGSILLDLATQLNAEIFYDIEGKLNIIPINSITNDSDKPILWRFTDYEGDISDLNFSFNFGDIVNKIIVIGSTNNGETYKAVAVNNNVASPLCYQKIGYKTGSPINDNNITSNILAQERADYELRQKLILQTASNISVRFNPFLMVNSLVMITNEFYNMDNNKFLIQGISFSIDYSGMMNLSISNIDNFSFFTKVVIA